MSSKELLFHAAGAVEYRRWLDSMEVLGYRYTMKDNVAHFDTQASITMCVGKAKVKGKEEKFIGVDTALGKWLDKVVLDEIYIATEDKRIFFVTKYMDCEFLGESDIPKFGISFEFDILEKLDFLKEGQRVNIREYFVDSDGSIFANKHKITNTQKVRFVEENEEVEEIINKSFYKENAKKVELLNKSTKIEV